MMIISNWLVEAFLKNSDNLLPTVAGIGLHPTHSNARFNPLTLLPGGYRSGGGGSTLLHKITKCDDVVIGCTVGQQTSMYDTRGQ